MTNSKFSLKRIVLHCGNRQIQIIKVNFILYKFNKYLKKKSLKSYCVLGISDKFMKIKFVKLQPYRNNEMNSFTYIFQGFQYLVNFRISIENHKD